MRTAAQSWTHGLFGAGRVGCEHLASGPMAVVRWRHDGRQLVRSEPPTVGIEVDDESRGYREGVTISYCDGDTIHRN
jgi:hypothetical protein